MDMRRISSVVLASILVFTAATLTIPNDEKTFGIELVKNAFAQNASNSSDLAGVLPDNSTDFGIPGDNTTNSTQGQTTTVPEFGNVAPIILVISVISTIMLSARTRLRQ